MGILSTPALSRIATATLTATSPGARIATELCAHCLALLQPSPCGVRVGLSIETAPSAPDRHEQEASSRHTWTTPRCTACACPTLPLSIFFCRCPCVCLLEAVHSQGRSLSRQLVQRLKCDARGLVQARSRHHSLVHPPLARIAASPQAAATRSFRSRSLVPQPPLARSCSRSLVQPLARAAARSCSRSLVQPLARSLVQPPPR